MLQNLTPLRKSAPRPPNISDEHVSCTVPATENVSSFQILFKCPTPAIVLDMLQTLTFCALLTRCTIPRTCHAKRHLNVQKWSEHVFNILTSKRASRHNGVHFFNISTSKSGPTLRCLCILTWTCASRNSCFSEPAFRLSGATNHRNNTVFRDFPTFSRTWIFLLQTFSFLIRATRTCTFSTSQLLKRLRS